MKYALLYFLFILTAWGLPSDQAEEERFESIVELSEEVFRGHIESVVFSYVKDGTEISKDDADKHMDDWIYGEHRPRNTDYPPPQRETPPPEIHTIYSATVSVGEVLRGSLVRQSHIKVRWKEPYARRPEDSLALRSDKVTVIKESEEYRIVFISTERLMQILNKEIDNQNKAQQSTETSSVE